MNRRTFGHPIHWKVLSHSARLAMRNRQCNQAVCLYQSALTEALALNGPSVCTARTYWRLGRLAAFQKKFEGAETYWLDALKIAMRLNKPQSLFVVRLYVHLAWNCMQQQQNGAALIWCSRAMRSIQNHKPDSTRLLGPLRLLQHIYRALRRNQDAADAHRLIRLVARPDVEASKRHVI